MKKTKRQATRIITNIFDIMLKTRFKEQAEKEMSKDLNNKNVSVDYSFNTITIEDNKGEIIQYTITIN